MERGEISAALLSDTFAYAMMKEGKLKCVRSLQDEDFAKDSCCVIAMNRTFVQENPVIAKKITQAVQKAHSWMHEIRKMQHSCFLTVAGMVAIMT